MRLYLFLYFLKKSNQLLAFVGIKLGNDMSMLGYFGRIYRVSQEECEILRESVP